MFRAALRKAGPAVLGVAIASALGVYADKRNKATIYALQSRVAYYRMREDMLEESRAMDRQIQQQLQSERDRLAEHAFYAYREFCRLLIDQEAARAFAASDTPIQVDRDDIMLMGPGNTYADDYNSWADANPDAIEAAQKREKARILIRMLDKPDYWSYSALGFPLRWLYLDRSTLREADFTTDSIVLREARADLLAAGLLKKEEEERTDNSSSSSSPPIQQK